LVWPQLWHWYLLRSNTYFLTSGGIGILGVLDMMNLLKVTVLRGDLSLPVQVRTAELNGEA